MTEQTVVAAGDLPGRPARPRTPEEWAASMPPMTSEECRTVGLILASIAARQATQATPVREVA